MAPDHMICLGTRRKGKSTLAMSLARKRRPQVIVFDPANQFRQPTFEHAYDIESALGLVESGKQTVVFHPADIDEDFAKLIKGVQWEGKSLIVDESSLLQQHTVMHPSLDLIVRQSPDNFSLIQTTHRFVDVHRLNRMLATDFFFFQTSAKADLKQIADEFESEQLAERIRQLQPHQFLHVTFGHGGTRHAYEWRDPASWRVMIRQDEVKAA